MISIRPPQNPKTDDSGKHKIYSLTSIINLGLVSLIVAIFFLAITTYTKLKSFETSLTLMTEESLPTVIHSGELHSQMSVLMSAVEQLSSANSDAMRRIAVQSINQQLQALDNVVTQGNEKQYMLTQVQSIQKEINELSIDVADKLQINAQLRNQQDKMYNFYRATEQAYLKGPHASKNASSWFLAFSDIVIMATEILTSEQISTIRQQQRSLNKQIQKLDAIPLPWKTESQPLEELHSLVLNPDTGLIALRTEQLKILGRVRGRGNFVRNLISDYARLNEFESHQLNEAVLADASGKTRLVSQQIKYISIIFIVVFIVYGAFVFFIRYAVVNRLKSLRIQVQRRAAGEKQAIILNGKDEIAELAHSFEQFATTVEYQKHTLEELSLRDSLTNVANRRALDERYLQEVHVATRQKWSLGIMLLDVDFFKQYNDNYGHSQGDECLKLVADILKSQLPRKTDFLARYGGEEFAMLLPDTNMAGVINVAESILTAFKHAQIPHDFSGVADHITISIGISVSEVNSHHHTIPSFDEADKSLYEAKNRGRNRWECYQHQQDS